MSLFCPLPWTTFQIEVGGEVYACCQDWVPISLGNIVCSRPSDIWESSNAQEIRRSIANGSFRYCRCSYLPKPCGPIMNHLPSSAPAIWPIKILKLNYDPSCNLSCPSCRSQPLIVPQCDPSVARVHAAVLSSGLLTKTQRLYLSGSGDPLASPTFYQFLRQLPEIPHEPDLKIELLTNGQLLDEKHWQKLGPTARQIVTIGISIDANSEKTYQENRGSSWERLWKNIDFILDLRRCGQPIQLGANFVVQANNLHELPGFAERCLGLGFDHVYVIYISQGVGNRGAMSAPNYKSRACHLPGHPMHNQMRILLKHPVFSNPRVIMPTFPPRNSR